MELQEKIDEIQRKLLEGEFGKQATVPFRKGEFELPGTMEQIERKLAQAHLLSVLVQRPTEELTFFKKEVEPFLSAAPMDTETAGEGLELTARAWATEALRAVELKLRVADLHPVIQMEQETMKLPRLGTIPVARKATQGTAATEDIMWTTGEVVLDPEEIIIDIPVTYTLREDSVIPLLNMIQRDIELALAKAIDRATVEGDTAATHQDADVTAADDARKLWNGYRKLATVAKVDFGNATVTMANLRAMRAEMGKYAEDPDDICWLFNLKVYNQLLSLGQVETVDKYGEEATIRTGRISKLDGIEIRVTDWLRTDLNASGVYDGTTTDRTICLLVRRDAFRYGQRREVTVELDKDIKKRRHEIVATMRRAFMPIFDTSTEPIVALGYNIAT